MAGILWIFCSNLHLSPDKSSLLLGVGHRVIRFLFQKFAEFFVPLIDKLNGSLTVGGIGQDVELDEISFRSVGRAHGIVWLRYLAAVRRGAALVWIERLPYRISSVGQGGEGPISLQEKREALLLDADGAILAVGSVCHTDGAKAYQNLASPLYNSSLLDFETLKLGHTCVKHKPPHPEFTKRLSTCVWNGELFVEETRWGGTHKLDGFFAGFRKDVGKRPLNTAGSSTESANRMEALMHQAVRLYQFKYWFGGHNLFSVFGELRQVERESPGSLFWASLACGRHCAEGFS